VFSADVQQQQAETQLKDLLTKPQYPPIPAHYRNQIATGDAAKVIEAARSQLGMPYVYGAGPRDPDGLAAIGLHKHRAGFDCSSFVAYAFQVGVGEWISGSIAHTDQIWTQGGQLPLDMSPGETSRIVRGTGDDPPPHGYRPGDILEMRWGAGGYFGHVVIVSEHGLTIQAFGSDVYETDPITRFLADGKELGWVRVKALSA
jgi:cell wall-associated NlpC family hydrolase